MRSEILSSLVPARLGRRDVLRRTAAGLAAPTALTMAGLPAGEGEVAAATNERDRGDEAAGGGLSAVPGRFGWDGGYGTSWYMDPTEGLIGILLTQRSLDDAMFMRVIPDFWTSAYQAIAD